MRARLEEGLLEVPDENGQCSSKGIHLIRDAFIREKSPEDYIQLLSS
jgi:hypothetical protein